MTGTARTRGTDVRGKLYESLKQRQRWNGKTIAKLVKKTDCDLNPSVAEACLRALKRQRRINLHYNPKRIAVYVRSR